MMKRCTVIVGLLFCGVLLMSGCRAFDSTYAHPEADIAAMPKPEKPNASGNKPPATPSVSEDLPDYSKDKTVCKTPDGVKVGKNPSKLMSTAGWLNPADGEQVTVTATKKGPHSAVVSVQKAAADKTVITLSFTVKQTAADKFSACDFNYSEGKDRVYPGVTGAVMVDQVNAIDKNSSKITNSGSFVLAFSRSAAATATKVQSVYLGATTPGALAPVSGPEADGSYFTDSLIEEPSK
jgi:hypothetical protein